MKKSFLKLLLVNTILGITIPSFCQCKLSLAEKLGYQKDSKLLIIHADDLGLSHSTNTACIEAFEKGGINSGSVMVTCPWFPEIAEYIRSNQHLDIGVHLTLTSEWQNYKWDGVLPSNLIPSLINDEGFFHRSNFEITTFADPDEVEKEIRAQIKKAMAFGINPTHIDTHMGSVISTPEIFKRYMKVGKEFGIPVFLPSNYPLTNQDFKEFINEDELIVDRMFMIYQADENSNWYSLYKQMITQMQPGLNQLIVHVSIDNEEMKAIAKDHPEFGTKWRQKDFDFCLSSGLKRLLNENDIKLVTWRQIQNIIYNQGKGK